MGFMGKQTEFCSRLFLKTGYLEGEKLTVENTHVVFVFAFVLIWRNTQGHNLCAFHTQNQRNAAWEKVYNDIIASSVYADQICSLKSHGSNDNGEPVKLSIFITLAAFGGIDPSLSQGK